MNRSPLLPLRMQTLCRLLIWMSPLSWLLLSGCSQPTPTPTVASGRVERWTQFESDHVASRTIDIWLPEGYDGNERYPVLYMHDGQMLFDASTTWNGQEWQVDETLGALIAEGSIPSCIVVGVWNPGDGRYTDYFPRKVFASIPEAFLERMREQAVEQNRGVVELESIDSDAYLQFLVHELKPAIDEAFATRPEPEHTFIAGSSMGGLISLYAICEYPEVFGGAACLSTHWIGIWDDLDNPIPDTFAAYLQEHLPEPGHHRFYFDHGTETLDQWYGRGQALIDAVMEQAGYSEADWKTLVFEGTDHSENAWAERLHIPLKFLLSE